MQQVGLLTGSPKTMVRYHCSRLTWNMAWNAWRMLGEFWKELVNFEFECKVFKATVQGALLAIYALVQPSMEV